MGNVGALILFEAGQQATGSLGGETMSFEPGDHVVLTTDTFPTGGDVACRHRQLVDQVIARHRDTSRSSGPNAAILADASASVRRYFDLSQRRPAPRTTQVTATDLSVTTFVLHQLLWAGSAMTASLQTPADQLTEAIMTIRRIVQNTAFGPSEIETMVAAFEEALRELHLTNADNPATELVASKVVEVTKSGIRDPAEICARAIRLLGSPDPDVALPQAADQIEDLEAGPTRASGR